MYIHIYQQTDGVCIDNELYLGSSLKLLSLLDCRAYKEAAGGVYLNFFKTIILSAPAALSSCTHIL